MNVGEVFSAVVMLIISFGTSVLLEYQDISFKINFPPLLSETSEVKLPPPPNWNWFINTTKLKRKFFIYIRTKIQKSVIWKTIFGLNNAVNTALKRAMSENPYKCLHRQLLASDRVEK